MFEGGLAYLKGFGMLALTCFRIPGGSALVIEKAFIDLCKEAKKKIAKSFVRKYFSVIELTKKVIDDDDLMAFLKI